MLLFALPLIIFIYLLTLKNTKKKALRFANFEAIARVRGIGFFSRNIVTTILTILIVTLLILAISGLTLHRLEDASAFSFILAIDTSRSMEAQDIFPNRLDASKELSKNFIDIAPQSTEIGIVAFSGHSFIHKDLTKNKEELKEAINNIEQSSIEGTDIYEAVITSTNLLRGGEGRAIILLSDGQITIGEIDDAIVYANDHDVIINTIAIGTEEGGITSYGISKMDDEPLKALAYNTEGIFFKARDRDALLDSFDKALKLTKRKVPIALSKYLLFAAIIIFIIEYVLTNSRFKLLP